MDVMNNVSQAMPDVQDPTDFGEGEIYLAGERVPAGIYHQIGNRRKVYLDHEDVLPASLDGCVACYERLLYTWHQVQHTHAIVEGRE